jgi:hypothetical protein
MRKMRDSANEVVDAVARGVSCVVWAFLMRYGDGTTIRYIRVTVYKKISLASTSTFRWSSNRAALSDQYLGWLSLDTLLHSPIQQPDPADVPVNHPKVIRRPPKPWTAKERKTKPARTIQGMKYEFSARRHVSRLVVLNSFYIPVFP